MAQAAHRIKGAAATLGIDGVHEMAAWIEAAARSGELTGTDDRLRALEDEVRTYGEDVTRTFP